MKLLRATKLVSLATLNLVILSSLLAVASLDGLVRWALDSFDRRMAAQRKILSELREIDSPVQTKGEG